MRAGRSYFPHTGKVELEATTTTGSLALSKIAPSYMAITFVVARG